MEISFRAFITKKHETSRGGFMFNKKGGFIMPDTNVGFTKVTPDTWNGVYPLEDLPALKRVWMKTTISGLENTPPEMGMYSGESCRGFGLMVLDATYGVDKCTHYGKKTNMTTDEKYKQLIRGLSNGSMFTVT